MAIEIIKMGQKPEDKRLRWSCGNCHAEWSALVSDAKRCSDQRDGDFLSMNCPCCNRYCTKELKTPSPYNDR